MTSDKPRLITLYIREWLDRQRQAAELTPEVERARAAAEWQDAAYSDIRKLLSPTDGKALDARLDLAYSQMLSILPMPPSYGSPAHTPISSAVATGTSSTYGFALGLRDLGPVPIGRAQPHILSFQRLQDAQNRTAATRALLVRLAPVLGTQFERANNEQMVARSQPERLAAAGLEIRTLLDNLQGGLFERARRSPGENMTWDTMASRLAKPTAKNVSHDLLVQQGTERGTLLNHLSALAKRRPSADSLQLSDIWPLVLEHLYAVCSNVQ